MEETKTLIKGNLNRIKNRLSALQALQAGVTDVELRVKYSSEIAGYSKEANVFEVLNVLVKELEHKLAEKNATTKE